MKKLFASTFLVASFIFGNQLKADWTHWWIEHPEDHTTGPYKIYTVDNETGLKTLRTTKVFGGETPSDINNFNPDNIFVDEQTGNFIVTGENGNFEAYNLENDSWTILGESWRSQLSHPGDLINRFPPIRRVGDTISIGENSLKLKETTSEQQLWGTNADGEIVPLNIVNGSKLLINGRDVEQSINNVGALSAALTGLPTVPTDTTLACGLGTGTHGGDFAFSGGCASKVNEKLSINYAASMTVPGQDYAGDFEDTISARAGFVWKLGKSLQPTQISMKETNELKKEISELRENNNQIIAQNKTLLARLERLEKIAIDKSKSQDLATIKLP